MYSASPPILYLKLTIIQKKQDDPSRPMDNIIYKDSGKEASDMTITA